MYLTKIHTYREFAKLGLCAVCLTVRRAQNLKKLDFDPSAYCDLTRDLDFNLLSISVIRYTRLAKNVRTPPRASPHMYAR